ncbi:MAG: LacI family DNA-binding transcriptional regulator [Bryobacteraceae bacterium]
MNLEEVAKRAKVSTATVSRVLNNIEVVKGSTRARVLKAVEELKYQPNLHARTLAGGKSHTLGVIVSNMENPFFVDVFRALDSDAHQHGYEVVLANTDYKAEQLVASIRLMIARRVAGLAVVVSEMDQSLIQELEESRIPAVFFDVGSARRNVSNVRVNYNRGIERVVEYLFDLGHRRMAFVGHHPTLGPTSLRQRTFVETVSLHSPHVEWRTAVDADGLEGGRHAVRELLQSGFHPTAIICVNDFMAVGVLRELREHGLRVPEDVSVTGFDNIRLSEYSYPQLTTVHIPRDRIGHIVFDTLVQGLPGSRPPGREVVIDPELVLRESTGPCKTTS